MDYINIIQNLFISSILLIISLIIFIIINRSVFSNKGKLIKIFNVTQIIISFSFFIIYFIIPFINNIYPLYKENLTSITYASIDSVKKGHIPVYYSSGTTSLAGAGSRLAYIGDYYCLILLEDDNAIIKKHGLKGRLTRTFAIYHETAHCNDRNIRDTTNTSQNGIKYKSDYPLEVNADIQAIKTLCRYEDIAVCRREYKNILDLRMETLAYYKGVDNGHYKPNILNMYNSVAALGSLKDISN